MNCCRLPRWHSGKESACQCRRCKRRWFDPWLGRSLGGTNGNPLQYACLGNSMDGWAWRATVHGVAKIRTWLSTHTSCCNKEVQQDKHFFFFFQVRVLREVGRLGWRCSTKLSGHRGSLYLLASSSPRALPFSTCLKLLHHYNQVQGERRGRKRRKRRRRAVVSF